MIGIGIDTGGTCTDVVVYDRQRDEILFSAKAQTTRHDLKIGICDALRKIPQELRARADYAALSTTMALMPVWKTRVGGPAASVIGGQHLAHEKSALIVDMGGTTTDISVVKNGYPIEAGNGIQIGQWRTMVHGVNIHTMGLGGDSRILMQGEPLVLDSRRAVPLCLLATQYPRVLSVLRSLAETGTTLPAAPRVYPVATGRK